MVSITKILEGYPHARLLAVTKTQTPEKVRAVVDQGITLLGNNYVQEGAALREALRDLNVEWHFIGHIQSRKAKELGDYDCIQSLDRLDVAKKLSASQEVLVQVNIGEEAQKSGVSPGGLSEFLEGMRAFPHLKVNGLMAIPPLTATPEERRPYFRKMRQLLEETRLEVLSMGMSDDYRIALDEGSNLIRLGTILFGPRV